MIRIFQTFGGYVEIPKAEKGCWINKQEIDPSGYFSFQEQNKRFFY